MADICRQGNQIPGKSVTMTVLSYIDLERGMKLVAKKLALGKATIAERRKILARYSPDIRAKILKYEKERREKI